MDEFITLQKAAEIAGYKTTSGLRNAALQGRLRTVKPGPRLHMTTQAWLDAYLAELRQGDYKRGLAKSSEGQPKEQDADGEPSAE